MVKVKEGAPWYGQDGSIDGDEWLEQLRHKGYHEALPFISHACAVTKLACAGSSIETGAHCFEHALTMADMLADLQTSPESIVAAILYVSLHYADLTLEDISEQFNPTICEIVRGVEKIGALHLFHTSVSQNPYQREQLEVIRKMLLAMVDDPRIVLIKLVERLSILRQAQRLSQPMQHRMAQEVMGVYAPLANRLGMGAIKWEMEDLAFRFLEPEAYKAIAKGLKERRLDRDRYVTLIETVLNEQIPTLGISHFSVYGRSKHIHSIYRKMQRKNVALDEIYDATALRVLVETVPECYDVLSLVHALWEQVPQEFDDYIAHPKLNGYQSLHTAVRGPENRIFEVQIRTFLMHEMAEMGLAAHWKYKENVPQKETSHERKITWLRDVLAWHRDMTTSSDMPEDKKIAFLEERVYVFTPDGDVLDLPQGVTPLDFAYYIHSELGHRCRGAKINGAIAPLTTKLKTSDVVEILSTREPKPSRDWLNPNLHYLSTSRARTKVLHWFRMQDYDKHRENGQGILNEALKKEGLKWEQVQDVVKTMHYKSLDDLLAALGRGDIRASQILGKLSPLVTPSFLERKSKSSATSSRHHLEILGVDNIITNMARCCRPIPGDEIVGYITVGRGVSIHRKNCTNILHASDKQRTRFVEVNWQGASSSHLHRIDIMVKAFHRENLLKDLTALLANESVTVSSIKTQKDGYHRVKIILSLEIEDLAALSKLLSKMTGIPTVLEVTRC